METLFEVENLRGGYHRRKDVIKGVSFKIYKQDILGIIGPNGSGKTTLLRLMTRLLNPQAGSLRLEGEDIRCMGLLEFCRKTACVGQDMSINFPFTVFEVVLIGRTPHLKRLQFETKKDLAIARDCLSMTDTSGLSGKYLDELSAGERQRVIIAKALAQEPVLLFLDEPTSHLDITHQIQILDLLKKLNRDNGLTIAMVLHDLNLASEYCNRLVLINEGSIFKEGAPEEVLTYQNIEAVYKTVVVVEKNPISNKPYVILVSGRKHGN